MDRNKIQYTHLSSETIIYVYSENFYYSGDIYIYIED